MGQGISLLCVPGSTVGFINQLPISPNERLACINAMPIKSVQNEFIAPNNTHPTTQDTSTASQDRHYGADISPLCIPGSTIGYINQLKLSENEKQNCKDNMPLLPTATEEHAPAETALGVGLSVGASTFIALTTAAWLFAL